MIVRFAGVGVRYPGADTFAVAEASFDVRPGERVGLLGPSGSGKTTLLNVAAGLVTPTSGAILRDEVDVASMGSNQRRNSNARVGMVHQQLHLAGRLRVVHNVNAGMLGRWSAARSLWSLWFGAREQEQVAGVLRRLGIEHAINARTSDLSGGQQQRVGVARVLRQQPELLLADEPVSAVDPAWSDEVLTILGDEVAARNATLMVSLHDVELARRHCDRLIGLRSGQVVFDRQAADVSMADLDSLYLLERSASPR